MLQRIPKESSFLNKIGCSSEVNKISEWLASNKLSLIARMVFHTVHTKVEYPVLTINHTVIEITIMIIITIFLFKHMKRKRVIL